MACGYRGPEVQAGYPIEVFVCPACACDLYARPPRSYAEMEGVGLGEGPATHAAAERGPATGEAGLPSRAARWISRLVRRLLPPRN